MVLACCIYCKKIFTLKNRQKWHNCVKAQTIKKKLENDVVRAWRKRTNYRKEDKKKAVFDTSDWKKCKRCGKPTPNRFGHCGDCLDDLSSRFDLDAIATFESGHTKMRGHFFHHEESNF